MNISSMLTSLTNCTGMRYLSIAFKKIRIHCWSTRSKVVYILPMIMMHSNLIKLVTLFINLRFGILIVEIDDKGPKRTTVNNDKD